jgi:hypothetical protein
MKTKFRKAAVMATAAAAATFLWLGSYSGRAKDVNSPEFKLGEFGLTSGLFNVIFAKELCSCMYVDSAPITERTATFADDLDAVKKGCTAQDNLPGPIHYIANIVPNVEFDAAGKPVRATVSSDYISPLNLAEYVGLRPGPGATAVYDFAHPENGCLLTRGPGIETAPTEIPPATD